MFSAGVLSGRCILPLPGLIAFIYKKVFAIGGGSSQYIAAVVVYVVGMTLYPYELDIVLLREFVVPGPEIGILFTAGKTGGDPLFEPAFFNGLYDVLTIGINGNVESFTGERFECGDHRQQFHAVIGGTTVATG